MDYEVTFRHTQPTEAIKNHVEERLAKLNHFLIKPNNCHVTLSVEKSRHCAEITLSEEGGLYTAREDGHDMYASIDGAIERLLHQLKKHKEKLKDHKLNKATSRDLLFPKS